MFGIGMPELIVIMVVALIVLGPKKLPEIARTVGRGLAEFRRATSGLKDQLEVNLEEEESQEATHSSQEEKPVSPAESSGKEAGPSPEKKA